MRRGLLQINLLRGPQTKSVSDSESEADHSSHGTYVSDEPGAKNWGFALLMQPARFAPGVPLVCFRYDGVRTPTASIIADL
jgi:hypothetical protein